MTQRTTVKYQELALKIMEQIASGVYPPGAAIPSQPELENIYKVSRMTVRKAVDQLAAEGYIRKGLGRGNGTIVLERSEQRKMTRLTYNFGIFGDTRILDINAHDIPAVAKGIITELERWDASLSMLPFLSERHPTPLDYAKTLIARNMVDGLFVAITKGTLELCEYLKSIRFPFVCILTAETKTKELLNRDYPLIRIREIPTLLQMMKNYREQGCKEVVLYATTADLMPSRTDAMLKECCRELKFPYRCLNMSHKNFPALMQSLEKEISPARLIISGNPLMERINDALCILGSKVPKNPNLVFYKHYAAEIQDLERKYIMIGRPYEEAGREAARLMHDIMNRKETGMELCTGEQINLDTFLTDMKGIKE